jgi:FixJ family two-component response regulator
MTAQREQRQKVFVVDDDLSVRRALQRLLAAMGYEVQTFASATEFLGAASDESAGCLILDVHMPGMDGLELQQQLNSVGSHLPVILITADKDPGVGERGTKAGAAGFLQKPFDDTSLLCLVNAALSGVREQPGVEPGPV